MKLKNISILTIVGLIAISSTIDLGNLLNCNVKNLGKNGISNDYILDTIIENFDYIKENDYIVIGKTFHGRIEVPYKNKIYKFLFACLSA